MSDKIYFSAFPSNKIEALAMLYLQKQDLSNLSPEEVYDKYQDACDKIYKHYKEINKTKRSQRIDF
mgnify:CR=1 FL=1